MVRRRRSRVLRRAAGRRDVSLSSMTTGANARYEPNRRRSSSRSERGRRRVDSDLPPGYRMAIAGPDDADELAALYATVFASYPFPITDPEYLDLDHGEPRRLPDRARCRGGGGGGRVGRDLPTSHNNAEMTDFATLPSQRGLGLAQHLLAALEDDMEEARSRTSTPSPALAPPA